MHGHGAQPTTEEIRFGTAGPTVRETRSRSPGGAGLEHVEGFRAGGHYRDVHADLSRAARAAGLTRAETAQAMRGLAQTGSVPPALQARVANTNLEGTLARATWLTFGTESARNPANLALAPMMLDLVERGPEQGGMTFQSAFADPARGPATAVERPGYTFRHGGGGAFPMSMQGAVEASRGVDRQLGFTPRPGVGATGDLPGTEAARDDLAQREIDLVVRWVNAVGIQGGELVGHGEPAIRAFIERKVLDFYQLGPGAAGGGTP